MFRLIKLAVYVLVGYVIYEFVQGMLSESSSGSSRDGGGRRGDERPKGSATKQGGRARSKGADGGTEVEVEEATGASHRQRVGRGVT